MQRFGVVALLALGVAGCSSSNGVMGGGQQAANPGVSPVHNAVFGAPAQPTVANMAQEVDAEYCPRIEVRDGTNVYRLGGENAMDVRYQATLTDTARECKLVGGVFQIKAGIEGKVIVGPRGGAGSLSLPVRMTLVKGIGEKPVSSKFHSIPVSIGGNDSSASFTMVETFTFAPPSPDELREYMLFVGFDSKGSAGDGGRRRKRR